MKRIIIAAMLIMLVTACKKEEVVRPGSASLMIFHGVAGGNTLHTVYSTTAPAEFSTTNKIVYGSFSPGSNLQSVIAGSSPLALYHSPDTLPKSAPLFKLNLDLQTGSMQSLFLAGTPEAPEYALVKDEPLFFQGGDSAMGIRFVNLMPDKIPVSINLQSASPGSEVAELPYKGATAFKKYDVKMDIADYVFEFRDVATGTLIQKITTEKIANNGKLTPNAWIYKNFAFALVGKMGATGALAPKVVRIPYARVF
ncbi:hypothetical protein HHL16_17980 [Pseudoflavitalea sp. G-6-1-2]|uniref:hypothetical protein n=1 Tax=Pseudoflavitalea sp. G-6-1-2 TaxID=2728841 RepID=UPI00146E919C|nr:hypothetical protein [Pseudoflavitalea sp. G-6-1-2]NML22779.1 hypothetical protein [Pseudoflavitalea sp. G-6-1-2]